MDMINILHAASQLEQPAVLATVVEVEGHAYRKAGAAMLLLANGNSVGTVSPGCIESDLLERVLPVYEAGRYEMAEYNMQPDEDPIWGESVGCGGVIRILLEPVAGELRNVLLDAWRLLETGIELLLVRSFRGEELCYELQRKGAEAALCEPACEWQFATLLAKRQRVVLFGAGPDAVPIYQMLTQSSFHVVVADWRPGRLASFPEAEQHLGTPEQLKGKLKLNESDAVIVCSHHLYYDREMIVWSLSCRPRYIGVMGSKKRIGMLFDGEPLPANVKAPIGLSIGAEGPYEIAVSITAELIGLRKGWSNDQPTNLSKGEKDEYSGHLSGGGPEQPHGQTEATARAFAGRSARQHGASCSLG